MVELGLPQVFAILPWILKSQDVSSTMNYHISIKGMLSYHKLDGRIEQAVSKKSSGEQSDELSCMSTVPLRTRTLPRMLV